MAGLRNFTSRCPYCGERQDLEIDLTGDLPQEFISDCTVCCRPIDVTVTSGARGEPVMKLRSGDDTA
ncbi:MAG TPA: CPXCG motif-containing cysteine-rich protein [Fibrobacteria bacterium]|nr:CPXCG motif-containing cysteine-rich protein [Fibrobacteria bacterium]